MATHKKALPDTGLDIDDLLDCTKSNLAGQGSEVKLWDLSHWELITD